MTLMSLPPYSLEAAMVPVGRVEHSRILVRDVVNVVLAVGDLFWYSVHTPVTFH